MRALVPLQGSILLCLLSTLMILSAQEAGREPARPTQSAQTEGAAAAKGEPGLSTSALPVPVDPKNYSLGPEDVVYIRVWREPDLSQPAAIRPDGMITMPLIGDVQASGATPEQLGTRITEKLSKFINHPEVIVSVTQVRSKKYYITGEVNRPGAFPLAVPTTVLQALTEAGGFKDFANTKKIKVLRGNKTFKFNYKDVVKGKNMSQNILLENGDYIIIP